VIKLSQNHGLLSVTHEEPSTRLLWIYYIRGYSTVPGIPPRQLRLIGEVIPHETKVTLTKQLELHVENPTSVVQDIKIKDTDGITRTFRIDPGGMVIAELTFTEKRRK